MYVRVTSTVKMPLLKFQAGCCMESLRPTDLLLQKQPHSRTQVGRMKKMCGVSLNLSRAKRHYTLFPRNMSPKQKWLQLRGPAQEEQFVHVFAYTRTTRAKHVVDNLHSLESAPRKNYVHQRSTPTQSSPTLPLSAKLQDSTICYFTNDPTLVSRR